MTRTIGIVGGSISGNKGAEAMVTAVCGGLRQRLGDDIRFVLFTAYWQQDAPLAARYPGLTVADGTPLALAGVMFPLALAEAVTGRLGLHPARWARSARLLAECDLLVDMAGICFSDGREIYLPFNVMTILPAMLLGVPVLKLSQAIGPFRHALIRWPARWLLPRCRGIFARGAQTAEHLRTLGLNCPVAPDVAFALNDVADMRRFDPELEALLAFGDTARPLVGISPSSVMLKQCRRRGTDYIAAMAALVRHCLENSYRVMLLPHSIRADSPHLMNNDLPVVRMIREACPRDANLLTVETDLDSIALRRLVGRCDLFVASRFHSMVSALAMEVPVAVAGWGHKYAEVLDQFAVPKCALDYREVSAAALVGLFESVRNRAPAVREQLHKTLPGVLAAARTQLDATAALLRGNAGVGGDAVGKSGVAPAPAPVAPRAPYRFRLLLPIVKWGLLLTVTYFVVRALIAGFTHIHWQELHPSWFMLAAAVFLAALGMVANVDSIRLLLTPVCGPLSWRMVAAVTWISRLGKYVPGKVASVAGAAYLLNRAGVNGPLATSVMVLNTLLTVVVGMVVSAPLLLWEPLRARTPGFVLVALAVGAVGGLVAVHPRVSLFGMNVLLVRILKRPRLEMHPSLRDYLKPVGFLVGQWLCTGAAFWCVARAFCDVSLTQLPLLIATTALAVTIGFVVLFAPGGIGVRESIYLAVLTPVLGVGNASLLTVVMRLISTVTELLMALVGWWCLRWYEASAPPAGRDSPAGGSTS